PVTVGQYARFVQDTRHTGAGGYRYLPAAGRFASSTDADWSSTGFTQTASHPVVNVSWEDANAFCRWLSSKENRTYRLPTEAEWEYACRAGTSTAYSFGDDPEALDEYAWFADNSNETYHEVASKKPNPWGLYDMHGSVAEWVLDQYVPAFYGQQPADVSNPLAIPVTLYPRVVRGGGWDDQPDMLR
ncbi:MAG: SUMF1/EgtB/PvdO family nonheme iron enzyme, partial [Candidatus Accumulibacter sp.]|nr:SUMF1/EgtB/PvdO family nonheme iron enzyme [Accumulibacter sp.]